MKILANKEIKNLFLSLSLVFGVTFLLAEVFLWLSYRRLSLLLLILFLLAGGAVWAVCFVYFNRQNQIMEQAILQINPALVAFMKYQNIEALNREILVELVDYIKVYENGNISVKFKFADELRKIAEYIEINTTEDTAVAG